MSPSPITLEFHSGVVRFDASFNLFVVLTHSVDDPQPLVLDGSEGTTASGSDRRGRVIGSKAEGAGTITGAFPVSNDLPRGLVVEVRGFDSVELREDGAMVVTCSGTTELPDWLGDASEVVFRRSGERLRVWSKSSFREGFSADETARPAAPSPPAAKPEPKKTAAKPTETSTKKPTAQTPPVKAESDPITSESSESNSSSPYRPPRMPAGSHTAGRLGKSKGLGCGTLTLLVGLGLVILSVLG
jgi:hypothetical protein